LAYGNTSEVIELYVIYFSRRKKEAETPVEEQEDDGISTVIFSDIFYSFNCRALSF